MPNPYIPRDLVHAWSDAIGENPDSAPLQRLLKQQRRLARWIEENAANLEPQSAGAALYLVGVVARIFDLAGGRLRAATWEQVRDAERRVLGAVDALLPLDDGFVERARGVAWRAQPHILDEALMSLFEREPDDEEEQLDQTESFKIYLIMWVATEVLDQNWQPPKGFEGPTAYEYVHVEPTRRAKAEEPAEASAE